MAAYTGICMEDVRKVLTSSNGAKARKSKKMMMTCGLPSPISQSTGRKGLIIIVTMIDDAVEDFLWASLHGGGWWW
jgi:hypothetical protein